MKKNIFIFILSIIGFYSCKPQSRIQKRDRLVRDLISAIKSYDTLKIFNLIDTNFYLKVRSKEQLLYDSKFAFEQFKSCSSSILINNLLIRDAGLNTKEYSITFCRDSKNSIVLNKSFDLILTFAEYDNDSKIQFLDFKIYREIKY